MRAGLNAGIGSRRSRAAAPVNTVLPVISSTTPSVGDVISVTTGTWTGSPSSYSYQWKRAGVNINNATESTLVVPANAATEAITCTVTAYNGASASVTTAGTTAVARSYMDAATVATSTFISGTMGVVSGFAGTAFQLIFNGVTKNCSFTAKGLPDYYTAGTGIIDWWIANGGGDYNGLMPRVTEWYNQGPNNTAGKMVQVTAALRPLFNLGLIRDDGTIPISLNAFNARSTDTSGTNLAVTETNVLMNSSGVTIPFDSSNFTAMLIVDGLSAVGTGAVNPNAQQTSIFGLKGNSGTPSNDNITLVSGDATANVQTSFAADLGLGVMEGLGNSQMPATPLIGPSGRMLVALMQTNDTGNTIDGITPTGTNCVSSIRVNNNTSLNWTLAGTLARTSNAGTSGGVLLGRNGENRTATGTATGIYAFALMPDPLVTGTGGGIVDLRSTAYAAMMKPFGIVDSAVTTVITAFGASSMQGYSGDVGSGLVQRASYTLGRKVRLNTVALAGARNQTSLAANKVYLSSLKVPGVKNIAVIYCASSDIGGGGLTGAQTWAYTAEFVDQLVTDGWDVVCVSTFVVPAYGGDAAKVAYNVEYNDLVKSEAEKILHGHISMDMASISTLQTPTDPLYFDGVAGVPFNGQHVRSSNGGQPMADVFVATMRPLIA